MSAETAAAHFHCKQMTLKVVMCQRRGRRRERTRASERASERARGRQGDTPKKRLIVYAEECCEHNPSSSRRLVGSHSQPACSFPDTSRHNEREKEAGCRNGNVAVKVPPRMFFLTLLYYYSLSLSPIPHTNTESRVAAKKGLYCHRGRAGILASSYVAAACSAT